MDRIGTGFIIMFAGFAVFLFFGFAFSTGHPFLFFIVSIVGSSVMLCVAWVIGFVAQKMGFKL